MTEALASAYRERLDMQTPGGQMLRQQVEAMSADEYNAAYQRAAAARTGQVPENEIVIHITPRTLAEAEDSSSGPADEGTAPIGGAERSPWDVDVSRLPGVVASGVGQSVTEFRKAAFEIAQLGVENFELPHFAVLMGMTGDWDSDFNLTKPTGDLPEWAQGMLPEDLNAAESMVKGIAQFVGPFSAVSKAMKAHGVFAAVDGASKWVNAGRAMIGGAVASLPVDALFFDHAEVNMVDIAKEFGYERELLNYWASKDDDGTALTALRNRVNAALTAMPLGVAFEGLLRGGSAAMKDTVVHDVVTNLAPKAKEFAANAYIATAKSLRAVREYEWAELEETVLQSMARTPRQKQRGSAGVGGTPPGSGLSEAHMRTARAVASRMLRGKDYDDLLEGMAPRARRAFVRRVESMMQDKGDEVFGEGQPHAPPKWAKDRVRKLINRKESLGRPVNEGVEVKSKEGTEKLGLPTTKEWIKRVDSQLSPEEIAAAREWYNESHSVFVEIFGEKDADEALVGWLASNQNVDPAMALKNMLKVREDFRGIAPVLNRKKAGLAEDKLRELFETGKITEGLGVKLLDFIDSALGASRRTAMAGDEIGGTPFVIDIHSLRDMGYVDWPMYRHLVDKHGEDVVAEAGVKLDIPIAYQINKDWVKKNLGKDSANVGEIREHLGLTDLKAKVEVGGIEHLEANERAAQAGALSRTSGSIPESVYETAAQHGRELTADLNRKKWQGGGLQPAEVQAIGWTAQAKRTGASAFDTKGSIGQATSRVSFEIDFGEGSPLAAKFPEFSDLPYEARARVTEAAGARAMEIAAEVTGVHQTMRVYGPGGWMEWQNPSAQSDVVATMEGAEAYGDVLGYLTQQTEVWATQPKKTGKGLAIDVFAPELGDREGVQKFWEALLEVAPDDAKGYQPTDGGIRILHPPEKGVGPKAIEAWRDRLHSAFSEASDILGITRLEYDYGAADVRIRGNDWKENPDGRGYLQGLVERYGPEVEGKLSGSYSTEYEEALRKAIAEESGATTPKVTPTPPQERTVEIAARGEDGRASEVDITEGGKTRRVKIAERDADGRMTRVVVK